MTAHMLPTTSLLRRTSRALRLDRQFYREVQADPSATPHAITIVMLVALAHAAGGMVRGISFGWNPWSGALFGLLGELAFFIVASCVIYATASVVFGAKTPYGAVLRSFGFATTPGLLILVAAGFSLLGMGAEAPILALLLMWRLAAGFMAVHQTVSTGIGKRVITFVLGVAAGLVAVAGATRLLIIVLEWAGVSSSQ